jgi:hypothetical protein
MSSIEPSGSVKNYQMPRSSFNIECRLFIMEAVVDYFEVLFNYMLVTADKKKSLE